MDEHLPGWMAQSAEGSDGADRSPDRSSERTRAVAAPSTGSRRLPRPELLPWVSCRSDPYSAGLYGRRPLPRSAAIEEFGLKFSVPDSRFYVHMDYYWIARHSGGIRKIRDPPMHLERSMRDSAIMR
jgi:hypothetical protein